VARKLNLLVGGELEGILESPTNRQENVLTLLPASALSASNVSVASSGNALSDGASPDTDTVEALADVDNNAHDLTILLLFESLTDGAHHDLEPEAIDVDIALVLVLVGPLATVLVLGVFPLRANASLEQVIVGLESKF
jgi:hypothetical protein